MRSKSTRHSCHEQVWVCNIIIEDIFIYIMTYKKSVPLHSQMRECFNGVRRYDSYAYGRLEFHLPMDKRDNLRISAELALLFRLAYLVQYENSRTRTGDFRHDAQKANFMVLREFDRVCQARGFAYMLYGDALLGAWRHGGMIPWDDDIDVIMPREQYEKIIDVFNAESANPSLRAKLISPSRGTVFIIIEAVGESAICINIFPFDCYADALGKPLSQYQDDVRRRLANRVFPDKNPAAAIADKLGFATEDRKETGLVLNRSILENVNYVYQVRSSKFMNNARTLSDNTNRMVGRLNIKCREQTQHVNNLSGGNQQKVVLAKWLLVDSEILILDEPTRGVDVGARYEIYSIMKDLAKQGVAIIMISSDLPEIIGMSDRVYVMHEGQVTGELKKTELSESRIMSFATGVATHKER